jgi:choline dehydrogenase-like flavoprotein
MPSTPDNWFQILIIGSGTAGAVLAARLSEDQDVEVGLVEAGGPALDPRIADPAAWPLLQGSAVDWGYRTVPQRHTAGRVHDWPRGKVIGGSTAINAMAHVRGHPSDFEGWVAAGCTGWGYADLMPYFIRSETYLPGEAGNAAGDFHGDRGPLHLIRPSEPHPITLAYMAAGAENGIAPTADHNGAQMTGPCLNTLTIKGGKRQTIADAYLTPAAGRPNLHLVDGTEVLSLILENGRCRGVRIRTNNGPAELLAETVIVSAGSIGSPCLLLRSGVGPADALHALGIEVAADLPGVGQNLHDHLLSGGNVYRARRPVPPSKYQSSESLMYIGHGDGASAPELVLACVLAPVTTEQFTAPPLGEAYTLMFGFTHPQSRGSIRLVSADPRQAPLIDPNYLAEEADRGLYLQALEAARAVGSAQALGDWRAAEVLPGPGPGDADRTAKRAFLEKAAFTHHHPVGTCRMGVNGEAVVGPDLKLRGFENLYICDASVIPAITTGPVNAAIVAIAERFGDLLKGRTPLAPIDPRMAAQ